MLEFLVLLVKGLSILYLLLCRIREIQTYRQMEASPNILDSGCWPLPVKRIKMASSPCKWSDIEGAHLQR